jgi:hypothetical protein
MVKLIINGLPKVNIYIYIFSLIIIFNIHIFKNLSNTLLDWLMKEIITVDPDLKGNTDLQPILNKQAKLFAVVIIPSLFKAYRASESWELRKLIMMCILAFLIYYPEDLICNIFEVCNHYLVQRLLRILFINIYFFRNNI